MKKLLILVLLLQLFWCCRSKKKADLLFFNGKIYTVDKNFSIAESFAVSGGRIVGTGSTKNLLNEFEAKEKIDLQGRPVYPGFIDAHCHFFQYATDLEKAHLFGTKSFEEVLNKVAEFSVASHAVSGNGNYNWILGRGWDQNDWDVKEFPTKEKLDSMFPYTPVYLVRVDGHAVLCNGEALRQSHVSASTKINGGEVGIKNGILTGILVDNAVDLVRNNIPPFTKEIIADCLLRAQANCFALGLTTVDDAGLGKDSIEVMMAMQKSGQLKMRIYAMASMTEENKKYFFDHGPIKTDRMNVRSFKMYADGALGSRGACLLQPYSDQLNHTGFLLHDENYFEEAASEMGSHGFQLCTHAIGDSANRLILELYTKYLKGKNDKRWRIEHAQVVNKNDFKLFGENDIIPSVQPTHATSDMYWAEKRLGNERVKTAYAYNDLLKNSNGTIAFGTDFPVENINPMYTFYAAVARKDLNGFPETGFQPENKISRQDALRAMTRWAAYSNFEENEKGSLENGMFADFIILDKDIMQADEKEIPNVKVMATYVNGEKVFEGIK